MPVAVVTHILTSSGSDFPSWLVAGGTLALAGATFWLARRTSAMADETRELAAEARKGIVASATQFRQERMPVVMPVAQNIEGGRLRVLQEGQAVRADQIPVTLPYAVELDHLKGQAVIIPIQNVGAGPAIGIRGGLVFLDANGAKSVGSQPLLVKNGSLPALGPGQTARLRCEHRGLALPLLAFQLTLVYEDGAGGPYRVTSIFIERDLAYGPVGFEPPPELQLPGSPAPKIPLPKGLIRDRITGRIVDLDQLSQEVAPDVNDLGIPPEDDPDRLIG